MWSRGGREGSPRRPPCASLATALHAHHEQEVEMERLGHEERGQRAGGAGGQERLQRRVEVLERASVERERGLAVVEPDPPAVAPRRRVGMQARKRIVLIAHDNRKGELIEWARFNRGTLAAHELFATGTTGTLIGDLLDLRIERFLSGPLGGDQQVGAGIAEGRTRSDRVLLGPAATSAPRRRRQGPAADRRRPQLSDRLQPGNRRLHAFEPVDAGAVRAHRRVARAIRVVDHPQPGRLFTGTGPTDGRPSAGLLRWLQTNQAIPPRQSAIAT
jgi:hypothetical protein